MYIVYHKISTALAAPLYDTGQINQQRRRDVTMIDRRLIPVAREGAGHPKLLWCLDPDDPPSDVGVDFALQQLELRPIVSNTVVSLIPQKLSAVTKTLVS